MSQHSTALTFDQECIGSTGNVIKSVLLGKADAGATFGPELEQQPDTVRSQIRTLFETPKIAPHPLMSHPRVPSAARQAVAKAVLALDADPGGALLLKSLRLDSPVTADYSRDYQALEEVDVRGLSDWGK